MNLMDELKELGVNIEEGLQRMMGNSALYEKMLGKLAATAQQLEVLPQIEADDYRTAQENAHTLKGVMGNLSITPLYEAYSKAVDLLRADRPAEAQKVIESILPIQNDIFSCINKYKNP